MGRSPVVRDDERCVGGEAMSMKELIAELHPVRSGVVCDGLDICMERLKKELPFTIHEFASGSQCNGWIVPQKWECQRATIHDQNGQQIYDGNAHPLGVIAYSQAMTAEMDGAELKQHLFFSEAHPRDLIYHCDLLYKPHIKQWGFCTPKLFHDAIDDSARYHVDLRTTFEPGTMKVAEYVLPGEIDESIALCAHICHPGCSNDDLSGVAVGIECMRRLAVLDRRYTYRLLVVPEHYGSIFYLDRFGRNKIAFGLFLESLGSSGPLALQRSFQGNTRIDRAMLNVLQHAGLEWRTDAFRKIVGNDETCFDAAGIEIACPSLSRVPFPEYHTSLDNPDLMDEERLRDAVTVVMESLAILDQDVTATRKFVGLICLSNPIYDLYKPMSDPSIPGRREITPLQRSFNYLMDCFPRYFDELTPMLDVAERHELPWRDVWNYVKEFEARHLVETEPLSEKAYEMWHRELEPK